MTELEPLTGSITAGDELAEKAHELENVRAAIKEMGEVEKKLAAAIKEELLTASAAELVDSEGRLLAKVSRFEQARVDSKKLQALHPDIYAVVAKTQTITQLRLP